MTTSEQINEIAAALAKAQGAMKNASLNKVNPHFKSKYADLAGIRDAVIPALTANGIAVVQTLDCGNDGQAYLLTRLVHTSGQWIESLCPIPSAPDMQKMGSAITYARRYSLSAICGIAADEDDDAETITRPNAQQGTERAKLTPPQGFGDWFDDLSAVSDNGTAALQKAWQSSQPVFRTYLLATNTPAWEALKARAVKVKPEAVPV